MEVSFSCDFPLILSEDIRAISSRVHLCLQQSTMILLKRVFFFFFMRSVIVYVSNENASSTGWCETRGFDMILKKETHFIFQNVFSLL